MGYLFYEQFFRVFLVNKVPPDLLGSVVVQRFEGSSW